MAFSKKTVKDIDVDGKRVLMRVDFNVPLGNGVGNGVEPELSLKPAADKLAELTGLDVTFVPDTYGQQAADAVAAMEPGQVVVLENVRFDKREKKNDPEIADKLAALGDIFVLDAFGTAHRAQGSVVGPAAKLPAVAGFLLEKEVDTLTNIFENPDRPIVAIDGGSPRPPSSTPTPSPAPRPFSGTAPWASSSSTSSPTARRPWPRPWPPTRTAPLSSAAATPSRPSTNSTLPTR